MVGPLLGTPLLAAVSHYPQGDWHLGAPFYLCAAIQAVAAIIGLRYFAKHRHEVHAERVTT
jgi:DHA1 family tetracycline resistance protein-like MFS transporter